MWEWCNNFSRGGIFGWMGGGFMMLFSDTDCCFDFLFF
jgi:hypothetical protein